MKKANGKLTIKEINNWVWEEKWVGKVDRLALQERIEDLLYAEEELNKLQEKLQSVKKIIKELF